MPDGMIHDYISLLYLQMLCLFGPVPVAARSKAWVSGRLPPGIVDLNPAGGTDVCLLLVLSGRGRRDGLITRPEEPYRVWCVSVIKEPHRGGLDPLGLSNLEGKINSIWI
jgi:hypothetical protein